MRFVSSLSALIASSLLLVTTTSAHAEKTYAYNESLGTPPGWHVEERPRTALAITGGAIAATGALFFAYGLSERAAARRRAEELRPHARGLVLGVLGGSSARPDVLSTSGDVGANQIRPRGHRAEVAETLGRRAHLRGEAHIR